jgi:lipopolysaccharide export system protein LptA
MTRHATAIFSAILLSTTLGGGALAQIAPEGKGPVAITADDLTVHNKDCEAIYSGNAEALQDTSRLRSNIMNFFNKKLANPHPGASPDSNPNCGELERMEAHGNVYYVTPTRVVKGDDAIYTADNTTIVMTGAEVVATQGKNVVSGTRLTINTTTGEATMVNEHTGRNAKDRVHSVIYPQDKTQGPNGAPAPGAAPPAAKPAPKPSTP